MTTETLHARFIADMEAAGLEVEHYHGRYFWHGPSVVVPDNHAVLRMTDVQLQWDQLGLGWVVYPVAPEPDREGCPR